jgi:hypothetical protein
MNFNGVKLGNSGMMGTGVVANNADVMFGAFVQASATDGYIQMTTTGTNVHSYLGIANDDTVHHTYNGFYDAGDRVPIIMSGAAYAWLLGGQTVLPDDYLKFPTALGNGATVGAGVISPETTGVRTLDSVAKYIGRSVAGNADYDQTVSGISGCVCTCANLADLDLVEGDMILIASSEALEANTVTDPDTSATTFTVAKAPLASHATSIKVYKLVQIPVLLE